MPIEYFLISALGYLLGGVLFSYHIPLFMRGIDIVEVSEDHNPGTANAVKYAGVSVGMICLAADLAKGFLPVWMGMQLLDPASIWFAGVMLAPVLGHATAPFYRFCSGGKAIAASFGVLLAVLPIMDGVWMLAGLYVFFSTLMRIRPNERRTVMTFGLFALWALLFRIRRQTSTALGCILIALTVIRKNRSRFQQTV